jgi:hypothetical protein
MPYSYFDFNFLQSNSNYMGKSSLLELLKKQGYDINIYQMGNIDLCYLNNSKIVNSCHKKVSYPFVIPSNQTSLLNSSIVLASQWLISTGMVKDVNPLLKILKYLNIGIDAFNFNIANVGSYDAFKTFDMILHDLEYNIGNQAYFAVIDLPSSSYIYDENCSLKNIKDWISEDVSMLPPAILANKQNAYYNQLQCTYGYLNKFLKQLKNMGLDENTTVIINSANVPNQIKKINNNDDYYKFLQNNQQMLLAIKPAKSNTYKFDYRVCYIKNILSSYFMDTPKCDDLNTIKTTKNNINYIKKMVAKDKFDISTVTEAQDKFSNWFKNWARVNDYEYNDIDTTKINTNSDENVNAQSLNEQNEADLIHNIENTTNEKDMSSSHEVIPHTLFDNSTEEKFVKETQSVPEKDDIDEKVEKIVETVVQVKNTEEEKIERIVDDVQSKKQIKEKAEDIIQAETTDKYNPKQGYDLKQIIKEAKEQIENQEEKIEQLIEEKTTNTKEVVSEIKENISKENENIKNILVAPQTNGKKMTPEELKRQYHEMLKQAQGIKGNTISVEIVE